MRQARLALGLAAALAGVGAGCGLSLTGAGAGFILTQGDDDDPPPLPNQAPAATLTTPAGLVNDVIPIAFTLIDSEGDPARIDLRFSSDGGATWSPVGATGATGLPGHSGTTALAAPPSGTAYTFLWNSAVDLATAGLLDNHPQVRVRLTVTQMDGLAGPVLVSGPFAVWNRYSATVAGGQEIPLLGSVVTPNGMALDANGDVIVADTYGHKVVRIAAATGVVTLVAGTGKGGSNGDNIPALTAQLNFPTDVDVDGQGAVYIADAGNSLIRRVDQATGFISAVAGNGTFGFSGDGGTPQGAALGAPEGVDVDPAGNLWIADSGNNRVRFVNRGTATVTFTYLNTPNTVINVAANSIATVAGGGNGTGLGDDGDPTAAVLAGPRRVRVVDALGPIYGFAIADSGNDRVRTVNLLTPVTGLPANVGLFFGRLIRNGTINTVAGGGSGAANGSVGDGGLATSARLRDPTGLDCFLPFLLWIADTGNNRVRIVGPTGVIFTPAGNGAFGFSGDGGLPQLATLASPTAVRHDDSFNTFVADAFNGRVRMTNPQIWTSGVVAGTSDIRIAGGTGTVLRTDGSTFSLTQVPVPELLNGIGASSASDVVAVGWRGGIYRWNGTSWSAQASGTTLPLFDVDALSASLQIAVGLNGTVLSYNNVAGTWSPHSSGTTSSLSSVWLQSTTNGFAVGASGTVLRFTGSSSWSTESLGIASPPSLNAVHGNGTAVFAVGDNGSFFQRSGSPWTDLTSSTGVTVDLEGAYVAGASQVWLVGKGGLILYWNGSTMVTEPSGTTEDLEAIIGVSQNDMYAIGSSDLVLRRVSGVWTTLSPGSSVQYAGVTIGAGTIASLNAPPPTQVVAVAEPRAVDRLGNGDLVFTNSGTSQVMRLDPVTRAITVVAGTGQPGFAGDGGTGGPAGALTTADLRAAFGTTASDVWAVGTGGSIVRRGTGWAAVASPTPEDLDAIHGAAANDLWAVGGRGTILHWNGTVWSAVASPTTRDLHGVFALSTSLAYAVGAAGAILRWNGTQWLDDLASQSARPTTELRAVWASGVGDVWAVGAGSLQATQGPIWRYTSGAGVWAPVAVPAAPPAGSGVGPAVGLAAIAGFTATDIFMMGDGGLVYHWNGALAMETTAVSGDLLTGFGRSATDNFAAGRFATLQHRNTGATWTTGPPPTPAEDYVPTTVSFLGGTAFVSGPAWLVGEDGTIYRQGSSGNAWTLEHGVARISDPRGLAVAGNVLFVADTDNARIRAVNLSASAQAAVWGGTNTITIPANGIATVAGGGGVLGDGGPATAAQFVTPSGLTLDPQTGDLYVADSGQHRIRVITASTGVITTFAGTGTGGFNGDGVPTATDLNFPLGVRARRVSGTLEVWVADTANQRVRRTVGTGNLVTVLGSGTAGFNADGLAPLSTELNFPIDCWVDGNDVYVADTANHRVRRLVQGTTPTVSTIMGTGVPGFAGDPKPGPNALVHTPSGLFYDPALAALYIADAGNNRIRRLRP